MTADDRKRVAELAYQAGAIASLSRIIGDHLCADANDTADAMLGVTSLAHRLNTALLAMADENENPAALRE